MNTFVAPPQVNCGMPPPNSLALAQSNCATVNYTQLTSTMEGSTLTFSCTSLLIRTTATIDYCPVIVCQSTGLWRLAQLSCGAGIVHKEVQVGNDQEKAQSDLESTTSKTDVGKIELTIRYMY